MVGRETLMMWKQRSPSGVFTDMRSMDGHNARTLGISHTDMHARAHTLQQEQEREKERGLVVNRDPTSLPLRCRACKHMLSMDDLTL